MRNSLCNNLTGLLNELFRSESLSFDEESADMHIPIANSKGCMTLLYSFDKSLSAAKYEGGLLPFFSTIKGARKMCDYILFCVSNSRLCIMLIELKHGKDAVMPQIEAGKCLARYIVDTYNRVYGTQVKAEYRYVAVRNSRICKKGPTRMSVIRPDANGLYTFKGSTFYPAQIIN